MTSENVTSWRQLSADLRADQVSAFTGMEAELTAQGIDAWPDSRDVARIGPDGSVRVGGRRTRGRNPYRVQGMPAVQVGSSFPGEPAGWRT
jgi:hypothetical protein